MAISCQPISVESPYVEPVHEHGHSLALVLTRFGGHLEAGAAPPPEGVLVGREDHQGRLCLATILDCCSRRIVGYSMDCRMKASRVVAALRDAIGLEGSGEHHRALGPRQPDQVQGFTRRLQQAGIAASMGGVGTAYDNAAAESLFATSDASSSTVTASRRERLPERRSSSSSRSSTRRRLHSSIGMMAPAEFERRVRARLEEATVA